jgi:Flp pilus assembly protein TadG
MNPAAKLRNKFSGTMRSRPGHGIARSERGQSLVELALLTPILLLLVIGIVEMGRYAYLSIVLGNAAESGALYGAQNLADAANTAGIQAAAQNDYNDGRSLSGLTVTSANTCGCDSSGTTTNASCTAAGAGTCAAGHWVVMVQVTATGKFNSLFKYPGIPQSLTVVRTVTMRVKQE